MDIKEKIIKYIFVLYIKYIKDELKEEIKVYIKNDIIINDDENSRKCDLCKVIIRRASYAKDLRSRNYLETKKQLEMLIPDWIFQDLVENKPEQLHNPESLKQIAGKFIEKYENELAKKMFNPYCLTDRALEVGFNISFVCQNINHSNST